MQRFLLSMVRMTFRMVLMAFVFVGGLVVTALEPLPESVDAVPSVTYYQHGSVSRGSASTAIDEYANSVETGPITTTVEVVWVDEKPNLYAQEVPIEEPADLEPEELGIMDHCPQWEAEAVRQGWPVDQLDRLDHIIHRESRCKPDAHNADDPGSGSYGLLQLNSFWCSPSRFWPDGWLQTHVGIDSCDDLFDPAVNLRSALFIYNNSGWGPWKATDPGATTLASTP